MHVNQLLTQHAVFRNILCHQTCIYDIPEDEQIGTRRRMIIKILIQGSIVDFSIVGMWFLCLRGDSSIYMLIFLSARQCSQNSLSWWTSTKAFLEWLWKCNTHWYPPTQSQLCYINVHCLLFISQQQHCECGTNLFQLLEFNSPLISSFYMCLCNTMGRFHLLGIIPFMVNALTS